MDTTGEYREQRQLDSSQYYDLVIHALTHEHTRSYYDRHALLYEKWCRDFYDGLYIRDLSYIIQLLGIIRDRYANYPTLFRKAFTAVCQLCAKPLLESKANERLWPSSFVNVGTFYTELTGLYALGDYRMKVEVCHSFRCIILAGRDPDILRADRTDWVGDGTKLQLVDKSLIQTIFRESGALAAIVEEFAVTAQALKMEMDEFNATIKSSNQSRPGTSNADAPAAPPSRYDSDDDEVEAASAISGTDDSQSAALSPTADKSEQQKIKVAAAQVLTASMLDLCMDFASDEKTAADMCKYKACDSAIKILGVISRENPRDAQIAQTVDFLWTILDCYLAQAKYEDETCGTMLKDEYIGREVMDFECTIKSLQKLLLQLLHSGYRLADKEVRNEVVIVMTLVAAFPVSIPYFIESGTLNILVSYSCVVEAGRKAWPFYSFPLANFRNFGSATEVDIQCKQIMWLLISDLLKADDIDALLCVASSPLIPTLLMYLEQDSADPATRAAHASASLADSAMLRDVDKTAGATMGATGATGPDAVPSQGDSKADRITNEYMGHLSLAHLRDLQVIAIKFLGQNSSRLLGEFLRIDGPIRVLDITFQNYQSPVAEHKTVVYQSLLLLNRCLVASNLVKLMLAEDNAVQTLLFLFEYSDDDATRAQAARLLSIMCEGGNKVCQQQVRLQNGIRAFVATLRSYTRGRRPLVGRRAGVAFTVKGDNGVDDPTEDPKYGDVPILITSTLDCISKAVIRNRKNETRLAREEGIDALMELLEVSPFVLRFPVLRLLSDMLENQYLITFMQAWRSPASMRSSAQILAHCWLDEEVRLNAKREKGVICNILDPLGNHDWPIDTSVQEYTDELSTTQESSRSYTVTKLTSAIIASRNVAEGSVPMSVRGRVLEKDIRGVIANIFQLLGLFAGPESGADGGDGGAAEGASPSARDQRSSLGGGSIGGDGSQGEGSLGDGDLMDLGDDVDSQMPIVKTNGVDYRLTPSDKQVVTIAQRYAVLREGEWWRAVSEELKQSGVTPIETDFALMEAKLEQHFDASLSVQIEQMELQSEEKRLKKKEEEGFKDNLIEIEKQVIKSEWLKKHGKNKGVSAAASRKTAH